MWDIYELGWGLMETNHALSHNYVLQAEPLDARPSFVFLVLTSELMLPWVDGGAPHLYFRIPSVFIFRVPTGELISCSLLVWAYWIFFMHVTANLNRLFLLYYLNPSYLNWRSFQVMILSWKRRPYSNLETNQYFKRISLVTLKSDMFIANYVHCKTERSE